MTDFWMGIGAGFAVGWCAASVLYLLVRHYDRTRGYDRARQQFWAELQGQAYGQGSARANPYGQYGEARNGTQNMPAQLSAAGQLVRNNPS